MSIILCHCGSSDPTNSFHLELPITSHQQNKKKNRSRFIISVFTQYTNVTNTINDVATNARLIDVHNNDEYVIRTSNKIKVMAHHQPKQ